MSHETLLGILRVQTPGGGWDELPLYQPTLRIGRSPGNDVILDNDRTVSGNHAQLSLGAEGWTVTDLDSKNGTFLDGQRLSPRLPVAIRSGQPGPPAAAVSRVVGVGQFRFQVRPASAIAPGESLPPLLPGVVRLDARATPGLVVYSQGTVKKFPIGRPAMTLGRGANNDFQINDSLISGQHARVEQRDGSYYIVDLNSTNGLTYGGQRVREHRLSDGDILYVAGKVAIQYRADVGFVPAAEAPRREAAPKTQYLDIGQLQSQGAQAGKRITIGRHSSNTIVLKHPRVSRYHVVIEQFGARFRLRDLNSDNGTFVNGKRVDKEVWIKEGDEISVASHRLMFQEDGITHFDAAGHIRIDALQIEKWYSKTANILKKVSLSIYPKEFVALVGASGAGKSTLLNTLTGFNPANGEKSRVLVNGKNLYAHMDEYRNEMGYVPQDDIIHRELTVYGALDYAAQLRMPADTTKDERHKRVMAVIEELGLQRQWKNLITALSGGQRKRVSMGVELLTEPGLFFLDEATSGLDPGTETEMMELLRELADGGRTVILVTHATKNVMMCDQVVFLAKGGYLAYFGPPNEALEYFEEYRTEEERRYKEHVEFDDIYKLIEIRGTPEEWGERFKHSREYQQYVVQRLQELKEQQAVTPVPARAAEARPKRQVSAFRQFLVLSKRNLRIIAQDKIGLVLMLAVAPLIGIMDFMWTTHLFDIDLGDATRIVTMLFMMGLIGILTGALSSVREIVKEVDIYRRERTVTLKLWPYILSKVWVGVILAAYQAGVFILFKLLLVKPVFFGEYGYAAMYFTAFLTTLSGYIMGLLISAAAPNQNIALFLVVIFLVPQFLFSGGLLPLSDIPGGSAISSVVATRWAFNGLVRITGIGEDVITDPCWALPEAERDKLTDEQKQGCDCMGESIFADCTFPGIRNPDFYDSEAQTYISGPEPVQPLTPTPFPSPTPLPTPTPLPQPGMMDDQDAYARRSRQQGEDYQNQVRAQQEEWADQREEQMTVYFEEVEDYQDQLEAWKNGRETPIRKAEGAIQGVYQQAEQALRADVKQCWLALVIITLVMLGLTAVFQKRKDVI